MDSPGYCAKYCTYSFIEYDTKEILDVVTINSSQGKLKNNLKQIPYQNMFVSQSCIRSGLAT